jgi:hypothetical protein
MPDKSDNSNSLWAVLFPTGSLGRVLMLPSIASLTLLLSSVFSIGLAPTLLRALEWYDWLVGFFLKPLKDLIENIAAYFDWQIVLQPHWKHVFILFNVYMIRSFQSAYRMHKPSGVFKGILGLVIGLLVGVASGLLALQRDNWEGNFLFALIPVLGLFAYGSLNGIWQATVRYEVERSRRPHIASRFQAFSGHASAAARRTAVALVVIIAALFIPFPAFVLSPGLAIVVFLVILHAFYNLWDAVDQVSREPQHGAYLNTPSAKIGIDMLRYFVYCVILIGFGAFGGPST